MRQDEKTVANVQSEERDTFILQHKASKEVGAYSVMIHLLKALLVESGKSKDSVQLLEQELNGAEDMLILVQLPFSWKSGLCGDFKLAKVVGSGAAVVQSLNARVLRKERVEPGCTNVEAIVDELRNEAELCPKDNVRFTISIQAVLVWYKAGVKFQNKPLSTYWKYWDTSSNLSKQVLGNALLTMLSRVEKLTSLAVELHGCTRPDKFKGFLEERLKRKRSRGEASATAGATASQNQTPPINRIPESIQMPLDNPGYLPIQGPFTSSSNRSASAFSTNESTGDPDALLHGSRSLDAVGFGYELEDDQHSEGSMHGHDAPMNSEPS